MRSGSQRIIGSRLAVSFYSPRKILGPEALPFRATLLDKSPTSDWLVVWHQDTALPLRERRELPGWGPWSVKEGVIYALAG
jgi:hypothetical protein